MENVTEIIDQQGVGFLDTPMLWKGRSLLGLNQIELPGIFPGFRNIQIPDNLVLGKRVERFMLLTLENQSHIEILLANTQIQNEKITIGEIDCLIRQKGIPIHIEVVYKFYLFDPNQGNGEIDHWIGPNRRDNLRKKLNKLIEKQLPLIHHKCTKPLLKTFQIESQDVIQQVCFKAQLFIPYATKVDFKLLNKDCLRGFYIPFSKLAQFSDCEFYIPQKADWLIMVRQDVPWVSYADFFNRIETYVIQKKAPLCWIKFPDDKLEKFFVVWW